MSTKMKITQEILNWASKNLDFNYLKCYLKIYINRVLAISLDQISFDQCDPNNPYRGIQISVIIHEYERGERMRTVAKLIKIKFDWEFGYPRVRANGIKYHKQN
jgi:hypothetical protein